MRRTDRVNENEKLNAVLDAGESLRGQAQGTERNAPLEAATFTTTNSSDHKQWQIGGNGTFFPCSATCSKIPSGVYRFSQDPYRGLFIQRMNVVTDDLIVLPDTANDRVLEGMRVFWQMQQRYKDHGLLYKRGVLLWGPPGSGKTATLQLLTKELVGKGGIVIVSEAPGLTLFGLSILRKIEPERRLIVLLEDVDETINRYGEHDLLALLDGEQQVDNVVMIATTNYPDRLGARIVNRPSRFDERILVDMPSAEARRVYFKKVAHSISVSMLETWVTDTEGLSVAHLRELTAAVLCLDQPYELVLERLRSMRIRPREKDGFGTPGGSGFAPSQQPNGVTRGHTFVRS
jgi:hypothetical protein